MPLGGMVGRVPLHAPRGFLPYPPVKDTGMISAVLPNEPAVLVEPANLQIAKVPRVLRPLVLDGLFGDTDLINDSLEKIFRFDGKVGPQIIQSGKITSMVDTIAEFLLEELDKNKSTWQTTFKDDEGNVFTEPPTATPFDSVCAAILRVFALVMGFQAKQGAPLLMVGNNSGQVGDINYLLMASVKELGDEAVVAALSVFQAIIGSRDTLQLLIDDMEFCLRIVDYFVMMMSKACGVPAVAKLFLSKPINKSIVDDIKFVSLCKLNVVVLQRVSWLFTALKQVIETRYGNKMLKQYS